MKNIYLDTAEMLKNYGYMTKPTTIGGLGYALMKASNENKKCKWLKNHLDVFFKNLRREGKNKINGYKK